MPGSYTKRYTDNFEVEKIKYAEELKEESNTLPILRKTTKLLGSTIKNK